MGCKAIQDHRESAKYQEADHSAPWWVGAGLVKIRSSTGGGRRRGARRSSTKVLDGLQDATALEGALVGKGQEDGALTEHVVGTTQEAARAWGGLHSTTVQDLRAEFSNLQLGLGSRVLRTRRLLRDSGLHCCQFSLIHGLGVPGEQTTDTSQPGLIDRRKGTTTGGSRARGTPEK